MKAIDLSVNTKDMDHVASSFVEVIHLSGTANVGQIVTTLLEWPLKQSMPPYFLDSLCGS